MSALTSASKIVCEWLWNNYSQMSGFDATEIDVKAFAEQECQNWLEGVYEMEESSDEMYPPWVTLIVTPAINARLQWAEITAELCDRYSNQGAEETALVVAPVAPVAQSQITLEDIIMTTLSYTPMTVRQILALVQAKRPQTLKAEVNSFLYKNIKNLKRIETPGVSAPSWVLNERR